MKKFSSMIIIVLLGFIIMGLIQITSPKPSYALPCCNNYGWRLCAQTEPWWSYSTWLCQPGEGGDEVELTKLECLYLHECDPPSCQGAVLCGFDDSCDPDIK